MKADRGSTHLLYSWHLSGFRYNAFKVLSSVFKHSRELFALCVSNPKYHIYTSFGHVNFSYCAHSSYHRYYTVRFGTSSRRNPSSPFRRRSCSTRWLSVWESQQGFVATYKHGFGSTGTMEVRIWVPVESEFEYRMQPRWHGVARSQGCRNRSAGS